MSTTTTATQTRTTTLITGVRKTYTHSLGLSVCFRQWRARSHCRFLHGYALEVAIDFEQLEGKRTREGWVVDFGGLKDIKQILQSHYDHRLLVAEDDPELQTFKDMADKGLADIRIMPRTSTEAFAEEIFSIVQRKMSRIGIQVTQVTVREHNGNEAFVRFVDNE